MNVPEQEVAMTGGRWRHTKHSNIDISDETNIIILAFYDQRNCVSPELARLGHRHAVFDTPQRPVLLTAFKFKFPPHFSFFDGETCEA